MSYKDFELKYNSTINNVLEEIMYGKSDLHFVESGVAVFIDQNRATGVKAKTRAITATNPTATILIKKKAFSTFKSTNDLRLMDKTEKMLLRATKALFALKVQQIRAYESLTKLDKFYEETGDFNFSLLSDLILSTKYLKLPGNQSNNDLISLLAGFGSAAGIAASVEDVIKIMRRNAFSTANTKTTWIVDPDDVTNYGIGPGTGVIELCTFTNFSTNVGIDSGVKNASFSILDPHRILNIIEDDIESAIEEALVGNIGLLNDLAYAGAGGEYIDPTLIVSSIFEIGYSKDDGVSLNNRLGRLDSTIDIDYIRDRLRVFYLGKWMINVNDGVHIFINSNKTVTSNNNIDNHSFDTSLDTSYLEIDETILEAERKLYTNQNISSDMYKKLRSYSDSSFSMQHVFGGYVKGVSESYSTDKSMISVSCQDNMGWLTNVRFMEEPALMDPRAPLEDPLTPYDLRSVSSLDSWKRQDLELLPENKKLLKSGLLSFDSGLLNGYNANESNIYQGQYEYPGSIYGSRIIQHPSGLIYRWRTGVMAMTSQFSPTATSDGEVPPFLKNSTRQNYGFSVANSIVTNLDVANVISVMVTGQPYNIETFTQQAVEAMNGSRSGSNNMAPGEALSMVLDSIRKQNPFYGNFKPFRMITLSQQTTNRLSGDIFASEENKSKVSILRKRKNNIIKKITTLASGGSSAAPIIRLLQAEAASIEASISGIVDATYQNYGSSNSINSEDLFNTNFNIFGSNKALKQSGNLESDHDLTRAMMRVAATRRVEDVRLNRDQNLLIISDQYDINPDIKAFILGLKTSGFQLFKGNYMDVYNRCIEASKMTMMEFFCNTQGHLEIRPPQYNKTPLSVLNGLYKYQSLTNKKIVPDFLFKMFEERISSLKLEIHYSNIRIAIIAMMMGRYPDSRMIPGVPYTGIKSFEFFGIEGGGLSTLLPGREVGDAKRRTGQSIDNITNKLQDKYNVTFSLKLGSKEDGDILFGNTDTQIGNFDEIIAEFRPSGSTQSTYDATLSSLLSKSIADLLNPNKEISNTQDGTAAGNSSQANSYPLGTSEQVATIINALISSFRQEAGYNPGEGLNSNGDTFTKEDILFDSSVNNNIDKLQAKIDNLFKELSRVISKRNSLVSILKKNREKEDELQNIEQMLSSEISGSTDFVYRAEESDNWAKKTAGYLNEFSRYSKGLISKTKEFLSGTANKGSLFDHLIDDDMRNLLGPGSGRRFVIYDDQIINYDVAERDPEVTRIDIFGSTPLVNEKMKGITGGENFTQWAGAVDYDLWRQYGYKWKPISDAPFISDPETQAKPLALQHLAVQRTVIFSGTIQLVGNEYYQPGDTIYIPSKGLLFYVNSVTHSFTYASSFTTSLQLINGHPPGVYLPTPVDIIGQSYSKDMLKQGPYFVKRSAAGDNSYRPLQPDSAIRFPISPNITESNIEYLLSHRNNMVKFYNMMTDISNGMLSPGRILLIRGFLRNKDESNSEVIMKMNLISKLFQNPMMLSQKNNSSLGDDLLAGSLEVNQIFNINSTSGINKELKPMILPNGTPVYKVPEDQILMQVSYLDKSDTTISQSFNCFSPVQLNKIMKDGKYISSDDIFSTGNGSIFGDLPRGGPSQSTWLEMDDLLSNIMSGIFSSYETVIEIGVLELDQYKVKLLKSLK